MHKLENNIYTRTYTLHSYEVGMNAKALPQCLLNFLLHSAWSHANTSSYSYDLLGEDNQIWVLSRFKAVIEVTPEWGEEITIDTWGKGTDRLFAIRDYIGYRQNGDKFISATSSWLIVDKNTKRPQRLNTLERKFNSRTDIYGLNEVLEKLPQIELCPTGEMYKIHYSDIDVNKHLTSAKYLQLMFDSFDTDIISKKQLKSFELNFLSEAHLNETITILHGQDDNYLYCTLLRVDDNTEICKARFQFI